MNLKKNNPVFVKGKVLGNQKLEKSHFKMTIEAPQVAQGAIAGQFVMISKWQLKELLLKRPFSFSGIQRDQGAFDLLYKRVGKGTQILAASEAGEWVEIIGPLGKGFTVPDHARKIAIVARGIGAAPLMPLVRESTRNGIEVFSFLSAQESSLLLCNEELESLSEKMFYTTDDGSKGVKGNVTCFLEALLEKKKVYFDAVYTCGSKRLARHVQELQLRYHFLSYISLEERMGCGIGSCKGCVINTKHGYQRVCKEGPVFPLEEVVFNDQ